MTQTVPYILNNRPVASHSLEILDGNAGLWPSGFTYIIGLCSDHNTFLIACIWCFQVAEYPWFCSQTEIFDATYAFNFQNIDDASHFLDRFDEQVRLPLNGKLP